MAKFHNVKTTINGVSFDSKAESLDWIDLRLREKAGQISQLRRQVTFTLLPAFTDSEGTKHKPITWRADFVYVEEGKTVVLETKGVVTPRFSIVERLFRAKYPTIKLTVHYVGKRR